MLPVFIGVGIVFLSGTFFMGFGFWANSQGSGAGIFGGAVMALGFIISVLAFLVGVSLGVGYLVGGNLWSIFCALTTVGLIAAFVRWMSPSTPQNPA